MPTQLSHLDVLEAESIHIFREVAAEFEQPVLLFSGGKDSIVMLRLAEKAFWPARIPFPVMHVDTGHNFARGARLPRPPGRRARRAAGRRVGAGVDRRRAGWSRRPGRGRAATGCRPSRCSTRSPSNGFDAVFGGGRRDEEKARAKERVYSFRDDFGQWDPKNQRPELWNLYNGRHRKGEHIRVFPLSNWTELDIWQYIADDDIELPSIYYAHRREVFRRDGMWLAVSPFVTLMDGEEPVEMTGALPHRRRRVVHRRGRVAGGDGRRGHRRGRRVAHHRARRDPGRRQVHRGRHGRPQARGVLLAMIGDCCGSRPRARSTTARARSSGGCCSTRSRSSRTSSRRSSARAATAGFDYTNLALLTDGLRAEREQGITIDVAYRYFATPAAQVHHRRHARPRAVHAQHGHRRVDRRPRARADRRPQGRARAVAPARGDRVAAAGEAPRALRQQDGPRRVLAGALRRDLRRVHRVRGASSTSTTSRSSRSRRCTATTSRRTRRTCRGTRARRCSTTSSTSTSAPTATSSTRASRCST